MDEKEEIIKKLQENLKDLEEQKNKQLIKYMYIFMFASLFFFFEIVLILSYFMPEGPVLLLSIILNVIIFFIICCLGLSMEVDAGYYECKDCHFRHAPKYKEVFFAPHMNTTRWLKCPKCGKKTWSKKVMTK